MAIPGIDNMTSIEVKNAAAALRGQSVIRPNEETGEPETFNPHTNVISALEFIGNQLAAAESLQVSGKG